MKPIALKVARIGNSRGIRIPAATLARFHIGDELIMEERTDGILLRPRGPATPKLSWEDTAREMAVAAEDWSDMNAADTDGLSEIPWESPATRHVAERRASYPKKERAATRRSKRPRKA